MISERLEYLRKKQGPFPPDPRKFNGGWVQEGVYRLKRTKDLLKVAAQALAEHEAGSKELGSSEEEYIKKVRIVLNAVLDPDAVAYKAGWDAFYAPLPITAKNWGEEKMRRAYQAIVRNILDES